LSENIVLAEVRSGPAKIRVHTYQYATPSEQLRQPNYHLLTLFTSRQADSHGFFQSGGHRGPKAVRFGDMIFVPAGTSIFGAGPGGQKQLISYIVEPGPSPVFQQFASAWDERDLGRCGDIRCEQLNQTLRRMGNEALAPGFASDILMDALSTSLRVDLVRYLRGEGMPRAQPSRGGLSPRQLRMIEEHVREWSGAPLHAADLAQLIGVSRGHFMRAFKQSTGLTVHRYVEEVRLDRAREMLAESDLHLKQIAGILGFATPSSFSLAFRKATAMTPGQYRRLHAG